MFDVATEKKGSKKWGQDSVVAMWLEHPYHFNGFQAF